MGRIAGRLRLDGHRTVVARRFGFNNVAVPAADDDLTRPAADRNFAPAHKLHADRLNMNLLFLWNGRRRSGTRSLVWLRRLRRLGWLGRLLDARRRRGR